MRFTKIPLIATLMAVALSLLIVLPGLGQARDITDGKLSTGPITVGVFSEIRDAQTTKMQDGGTDRADGTDIFVPIIPEPTPDAGQTGTHAASGDTAHLMSNTSSPRDTLFRNSLYVSNDMDAYNAVLVNFAHPDGTDAADYATCKAGDPTSEANVTAVVKNNRSGKTITLELALATAVGTAQHSQAFFKVVHEDIPKYDPDPNTADDEIAYKEFNGPTFCPDTTADFAFDVNDDNGTIADDRACSARDCGYDRELRPCALHPHHRLLWPSACGAGDRHDLRAARRPADGHGVRDVRPDRAGRGR